MLLATLLTALRAVNVCLVLFVVRRLRNLQQAIICQHAEERRPWQKQPYSDGRFQDASLPPGAFREHSGDGGRGRRTN